MRELPAIEVPGLMPTAPEPGALLLPVPAPTFPVLAPVPVLAPLPELLPLAPFPVPLLPLPELLLLPLPVLLATVPEPEFAEPALPTDPESAEPEPVPPEVTLLLGAVAEPYAVETVSEPVPLLFAEPVPLPSVPPAETDPVPSVLADVIESVVDAA